ncbi:hypothetical protein BDZ89DRAFT_1246818 [Hymenopellis radicata]|nr:hypothetical protein BDZ89DRAFT_1246818 [Hymenopellis radicata]
MERKPHPRMQNEQQLVLHNRPLFSAATALLDRQWFIIDNIVDLGSRRRGTLRPAATPEGSTRAIAGEMDAVPSADGQHYARQLHHVCHHDYGHDRDTMPKRGPTQSQADLAQGFVGPWLGGGVPPRSSLAVHSCKPVISPHYSQKHATKSLRNWCHVGITCWLGFVLTVRSLLLLLLPPSPLVWINSDDLLARQSPYNDNDSSLPTTALSTQLMANGSLLQWLWFPAIARPMDNGDDPQQGGLRDDQISRGLLCLAQFRATMFTVVDSVVL